MGLAASQARFLGITLRKANLEFKSTELAQQRMQLTNQMSKISEDYASAINATKLSWINEDIDGTFGFTYGLLMTPSVANGYNPFMVTTKSGAIVLNSGYKGAAEAAGIPMAGMTPSDAGYKNFIKALGVGDAAIEGQNIITKTTQATLLSMNWHSTAGMGAIPKDKSTMNQMTLSDLIMDPDIGGQTLDWLQIYREALGDEYEKKLTETTNDNMLDLCNDNITKCKLAYKKVYGTEHVLNEVSTANSQITVSGGTASYSGIMSQFKNLEDQIKAATDDAKKLQYTKQLEFLKSGYDANGNLINGSDGSTLKYPLYWAIYEKSKYSLTSNSGVIHWADNILTDGTADSIGLGKMFHIEGTRDIAGGESDGNKTFNVHTSSTNVDVNNINNVLSTMTVFVNDVMEMEGNKITSMTLGDLLSENVVLMTQVRQKNTYGASINTSNYDRDTAIKTLEITGNAMIDYIGRILGYGSIGTGLNIDDTTNQALNEAMNMVRRKFLSVKGLINVGELDSDSNPFDNSAYVNANKYNRIGIIQDNDDDPETYAALNLSNMVSAFLTYFDNALRGAESDYVVGKSNEVSPDGGAKTYFITDDPDYIYLTNTEDALTNDEKINDFYSELYNSICEHGWRYDGNLDDYEYLENSIKDGRYALSALNTDGYFYQARYNDIEYVVEESDRDAIARAEADFTRKKAEITAKEDKIDIRTKKLDAEIAELTTELNSVQNLITKSIEKTFALFSN